MPSGEETIAQLDGPALQKEALAFWQAHRESSPAQIASVYLGKGSRVQVIAAINFLMEKEESEALKLFESQVLADPSLERWGEAVKAYLRKGREAKALFWQKLRPEWAGELAGLERQDMYELGVQFASGDAFLNLLDRYAGGQTLVDILRANAESEDGQKVTEGFQAALESLRELPEGKQVPTLLDALKVDDSSAHLFIGLNYIRYFVSDYEELVPARRPFWQALLKKTEPLPAELTRGNIPHLAGFAAYVLEEAAVEEGEDLEENLAALGAEQFYPLCLQRAEAHLAGEDVGDWPSADSVDAEQREKMLASLKEAPVLEKIAVVENWSLDEKMAWAEMSESWEEEDAKPQWLNGIAPVILQSKLTAEEQESFPSLAAGQELSLEWLTGLVKSWPEDAPEKDGLPLVVNVNPKGGFGLVAEFKDTTSNENRYLTRAFPLFQEKLAEGSSVFAVALFTEGQRVEVVLVDGEIPEDDEEWETLSGALRLFTATAKGKLTEEEVPVELATVFLARYTPPSLKKLQEQDADEE